MPLHKPNNTQTITSITTLENILETHPFTNISHFWIDEEGQLCYHPAYSERRCSLFQSQAQYLDRCRFNNWRVGIVINGMLDRAKHQQPKHEGWRQKLADLNPHDAPPSLVALQRICHAVRLREVPAFELRKSRNTWLPPISQHYRALTRHGQSYRLPVDREDVFLGIPVRVATPEPRSPSPISIESARFGGPVDFCDGVDGQEMVYHHFPHISTPPQGTRLNHKAMMEVPELVQLRKHIENRLLGDKQS